MWILGFVHFSMPLIKWEWKWKPQTVYGTGLNYPPPEAHKRHKYWSDTCDSFVVPVLPVSNYRKPPPAPPLHVSLTTGTFRGHIYRIVDTNPFLLSPKRVNELRSMTFAEAWLMTQGISCNTCNTNATTTISLDPNPKSHCHLLHVDDEDEHNFIRNLLQEWVHTPRAQSMTGGQLISFGYHREAVPFWLGISDYFGQEGQWQRIAIHHNDTRSHAMMTKPLLFQAWDAGEPNNYGGHEDCAVMLLEVSASSSDYRWPGYLLYWNDVPCFGRYAFVVLECEC